MLHKGQKLKMNLFGRKFKILAGEDEQSTVVKEIRINERAVVEERKGQELIIQIDEESGDSGTDSMSDDMDSAEENDISIS